MRYNRNWPIAARDTSAAVLFDLVILAAAPSMRIAHNRWR
jgi:hypothetical protein